MKIAAVVLGITLVAGLTLAAFRMNASAPVIMTEFDSAGHFDTSAATDDRIRALEAAVAQERNARQLLEEELRILFAEIEKLNDERESAEEDGARRAAVAQENRLSFDAARSSRPDRSPEGRRKALINAGFAPDRADWIIQRESELQVQAMQARFDARRSGDPMNPLDTSFSSDSTLRAIGDIEYEQYLAANGRPTAVQVSNVMDSSPGQVAGIRAGDQITSYDGQRIFSTMELTQQTMQGVQGDSVVVGISRDGVPMQIVLPRGPIGVSTSRFSRRR